MAAAMAAIFIAGLPGALAAVPPPLKAPSPPGPVGAAMTALVQELSAATPASMPAQQRLEALLQFRHSPASAALLEKIYGSTPAWTLSRLPSADGAAHYRGVLSALHYSDADGSTDWAALPIELAVSGDGRAVTYSGAWPSLASVDKTVRVTMRDLTLAGQQQRAADQLSLGSISIDVASMAFEPVGGGPRFVMEGIHNDSSMDEQNGRLGIGYQLAVRRIAIGGDGVDNLKLVARLGPLERASMLELQAFSQQPLPTGASVEQRQAQLAPLLKALARGVIRSGSVLDIDELSASFHGQTIRASGRLSLDQAVEADADNLPALLKKLVGRLDIKAPLALLTAVSNTMAELQIRAKNQGVAAPQAVAQLAATIGDAMLGKMVASGFVRVEGDLLVTDIVYSGSGGVRINGKAAPLPALGTNRSGAVSTAGSGGAPSMLQARRIEGRCTLPEYPADIVKDDAPLSLTLRLLVKADGSVRNVTLAAASTRPAYDQAVVAAAARCVYLPALRNGQPVDVPVVWKIVREAGSTRP